MQVAEVRVLELVTRFADVHQKLGRGVERDARDSRGGAKTHSLGQESDELDALVAGELVHAHVGWFWTVRI
jgi:hypothetical protein